MSIFSNFRAQRDGRASRRLLDVITNVTAAVPSFSHHSPDMVVERFSPSPYDGMTCTWYSSPSVAGSAGSYQRYTPERVFHCSPTNKTVLQPSKGKQILASVAVPLSLHTQLHTSNSRGDLKSPGGQSISTGRSLSHLTFTAFGNASLFPDQVWSLTQFFLFPFCALQANQ